MFGSRQVDAIGLERTFALNHVAYFVLTHLLRNSLEAAAPARIVNTASDSPADATLDFDDLQSITAYRGNFPEWLRYGGPGYKVYGRSKLCNILFTRELARRLTGTGVNGQLLSPRLRSHALRRSSMRITLIRHRRYQTIAISPRAGAEAMLYLAPAPEVASVTGEYFYNRRPAVPSREAQVESTAKRLWHITARLAALTD